MRPDQVTASPAIRRGNAGNCAEHSSGGSARPIVAICCPLATCALSTLACHDPVPAGSVGGPSAPWPTTTRPTASRATINAAPSAAAARAALRFGRPLNSRMQAAAPATPATMAAPARPPDASAATEAATTPPASQAGVGSTASVDRDERTQLTQSGCRDDLASNQIVHFRERLLLARGDDLLGRGRSNPRQGIQLLGRGRVQVDQPLSLIHISEPTRLGMISY